MITLALAGINIGVDARYDFLKRLARDYLTDNEPDFTVSVSDGDIERERFNSEENFSDGYLESIVAYRKIAEKLPEYDAFVLHGAVVGYSGGAYLFTAKSGTGKTTHTRLWMSEIGGDVHYLNGDKPIIRFVDGVPYAFGTPYRGKEGYGINEHLPLESIAFLSRGEKNTAREVAPTEIDTFLATQVYMPNDPFAAIKTLKLIDRLTRSVRLVSLECNMDPEAARVAFGEMTK